MHPVHLADMSKSVMSKLRNGHSVRAALGAKGSGIPAFLSEDNIKKLMKAGKRGGKAVIKLGAEELAKNRSEGSGIMAGGKLKMGGMKDFSKGFKQGFNAMGGVDGLVGAAEMMAGAGISAGPSARGGKLKMKSIVKPIKSVASNKQVQKFALDTAKDLMSGEGFFKDFKKGFTGTMDALGGPQAAIDIGKTLAGGAVRSPADLKRLSEAIAKEGIKQATGGKIKMKGITHAISSIAKNPVVQDAALDLAKSAMGAGLMAGGKIKMKHVTGAIKSIAGNKHVQDAAMDALKSAMSGEGIYAGAHGGSVKRKVIDLIEDIGENKPRKRGESRVRQAIDLVETMRKPRSRGGAVRTRSQKEACTKAGYHLQECVQGKRGRKKQGEGLYAGTQGRGMFAGSRGGGMFAGARGGAIGPHGEFSPITNVGAGGSLMCLTNPALVPQPMSENFFFHTQFPPALAQRMEG